MVGCDIPNELDTVPGHLVSQISAVRSGFGSCGSLDVVGGGSALADFGRF